MNFESKLDGIYEKATEIAGSTISQATFLAAFIIYNFHVGWIFINVISEFAITFALLLLRGQTVQSKRMEKNIHRTKEDTKKDLAKSDEILKRL